MPHLRRVADGRDVGIAGHDGGMHDPTWRNVERVVFLTEGILIVIDQLIYCIARQFRK